MVTVSVRRAAALGYWFSGFGYPYRQGAEGAAWRAEDWERES